MNQINILIKNVCQGMVAETGELRAFWATQHDPVSKKKKVKGVGDEVIQCMLRMCEGPLFFFCCTGI
jgi:hypothetical protein